jgi:hypothetical protein
MRLEDLKEFNDLRNVKIKENLRPGMVFFLPVPEVVQWEPPVICRLDESKSRENCGKSRLDCGVPWRDESDKKKYSNKGALEGREVAVVVKCRPFVVLQHSKSIKDTLKAAQIDRSHFYNDQIGLPIKSVKDYMQKPETLPCLQKQQIRCCFFLSKDNGIVEEDSFVDVSDPKKIQMTYFTDPRGQLKESELKQILEMFLYCAGATGTVNCASYNTPSSTPS